MKYLLLILLLLPFLSQAQTKTKLYVSGPLATNVYRGPVGTDSGLYLFSQCGDPNTVIPKANVGNFYNVFRGAFIYKDTCANSVWTSNPDSSWSQLLGGDTNIIYITSFDTTVIVQNITVKSKLRVPLTDTTHAKKGCGLLIYDTILEHYYGDVCLNGVHDHWGCFDCGTTGGGLSAVYAGYGLANVNDSTLRVDTSTISTKANVDSKTITVNAGTNVSIPEVATQNLGTPPSWTINASDSAAFHTSTQLNDSTYTLNRPNGTKDTFQFAAGVSVDSIWRTPGVDSIKFSINGRYHAIKDSTSSGAALTATQIGFGSASNLLTGVDSLTYDATNRLITSTNSQAGGTFTQMNTTTIANTAALMLQNTAASTSTKTGYSSPLMGWLTHGWKSNTTAADQTHVWAMGSVGITGAAVSASAFQIYNSANNGGITSGLTWKLNLSDAGALTTASNISATSGSGTFFGNQLQSASGSNLVVKTGSSTTGSLLLQTGSNINEAIFTGGNVGIFAEGAQSGTTDQAATFFTYRPTSFGAGTVTNTAGGTTVTGSGSKFLNFFKIGDQITISGESQTISAIASNTSMTTATWTNAHSALSYTAQSTQLGLAALGNGMIGVNAIPNPNTGKGLLTLAAGTATYAPIQFTAGTDLTTGGDGAANWDGTDLNVWDGTTKYSFDKSLRGSATLDFASTGAGAVADLTITVTGAADGDIVVLGVPNGSVTATATFSAWVSASNTVTVRFSPKATEDPASGTFKVRVIK